ncbi:hypothetical protein DICA3_B06700 [Diutina catenulata]
MVKSDREENALPHHYQQLPSRSTSDLPGGMNGNVNAPNRLGVPSYATDISFDRAPRHRSRERRDHSLGRYRDHSSGRYRDQSVGRYRDMSTGRYRYREAPASVSSMNMNGPGGYGSTERRNSASDLTKQAPPKPLFQRLLSNHYSVSNPYATDPNEDMFILDDASIYSSAPLLRPQKLIGNYERLANWAEAHRDPAKMPRATQDYYREQNALIDRYEEIDNFLDNGQVHYNTLFNYEDDELPPLAEADESPLISRSNSQEMTPSNSMSKKNKRAKAAPVPTDEEGGNVAQQYLGFNENEERKAVVLAILVNFAVNVILLIGKVIVAVLTNSISMVASLVDSILDFLSTFIIFIANKLAQKKNWRIQQMYPVGRSRLEPLGVLIFSVIIIISFFQVGQEAFKRLFFPGPGPHVPAVIGKDAITIMLLTILAKVGCWVWCASSTNSSVQALAQDAMTDIVFNTVSLLMPTIGHMLDLWWFDPLGAFLLSIYVIVSWSSTAFEHIQKLTGTVAGMEDYKTILYLAYRFAEPIKQITALKVYHFGDKLVVEIDVVFGVVEYNLNFKDCHDLAEALQYAIESLPMVERAFVHIDYMEGNYKGHLQ